MATDRARADIRAARTKWSRTSPPHAAGKPCGDQGARQPLIGGRFAPVQYLKACRCLDVMLGLVSFPTINSTPAPPLLLFHSVGTLSCKSCQDRPSTFTLDIPSRATDAVFNRDRGPTVWIQPPASRTDLNLL